MRSPPRTDKTKSRERHFRLHRDLLQPPTPTQHPRPTLARRLRDGNSARYGPFGINTHPDHRVHYPNSGPSRLTPTCPPERGNSRLRSEHQITFSQGAQRGADRRPTRRRQPRQRLLRQPKRQAHSTGLSATKPIAEMPQHTQQPDVEPGNLRQRQLKSLSRTEEMTPGHRATPCSKRRSKIAMRAGSQTCQLASEGMDGK